MCICYSLIVRRMSHGCRYNDHRRLKRRLKAKVLVVSRPAWDATPAILSMVALRDRTCKVGLFSEMASSRFLTLFGKFVLLELS